MVKFAWVSGRWKPSYASILVYTEAFVTISLSLLSTDLEMKLWKLFSMVCGTQ